MAQPDDPGPARNERRASDRLGFLSRIPAGAWLQAGVVAGMGAITLTVWLSHSHDVAMQGQVDIIGVRAEIASGKTETATGLANLKIDLTKQIDQVRADIVALPDVRAQMTMLGREQTATDNRIDAQSTRLEQLQQTEIEDRADVKNLRFDVDALKHAGENAPIRVPR